jgi:dihydroflavonol-4-reductase
LRDLGVQLVIGDLSSEKAIRDAMAGADGAIHLAGSYVIGIPTSARPTMYEANVSLTQRVLDAAIAQGIPRMVYISTANVLGNTRGRILDETFRRDPADGYLSYYDETKTLAHIAAETRIEAGAPIVIVMPGTVYGRGDHSGVGAQLKAAFDGTAPYIALGGVGVSPTYVDDLATGIVAALDQGRAGEAYLMAGENMRLRDAMRRTALAAGHRPPRLSVPDALLRMGARLAPGGGGMFGLPPNLREIMRASGVVTYWASSAKAAAELGYATRNLETGARDAYGPA